MDKHAALVEWSRQWYQNILNDTGKDWNYGNLSANPNITWEIVKENPRQPWHYFSLSENPNITWEIVQANPKKPWDYYKLSANPNITWEIVQANPQKQWEYFNLCTNPNITWEIVQANPQIRWDYYYLSKNPNITWEIVQAHPEKNWSYQLLSANPNITWDIVRANPQKQWDYTKLSANPNITWEIVQANPQIRWAYHELSMNPNITWDIVQANPQIEWNYDWLGANPNITWDIIKANPQIHWSGLMISLNKMTPAREAFIREHTDSIYLDIEQYLEAAKAGNVYIVRDLIARGVNVNIQNGKKDTALILAASNGYTEIVDLILKANADVNIQNNNGDTALTLAAYYGHKKAVELLLKADANVYIQTNKENTALTLAASEGYTEIADLLLQVDRGIVDIQNENGDSALIMASTHGHIKVVELLIKAGANVNLQNYSRYSAIIMASEHGHIGIVDLLIKAGANINLHNNLKNTALILAASYGHIEIVDLLLKAGADYTVKNKDGKTALNVAKSPEIRALINSYIPKRLWKGFTQTDVDKFKTIFETEAPIGQTPRSLNYSCCPVCLAWIERSDACMYMKHKCPDEFGASLYHRDLYNKFNDNGFIQWCTICGRICNMHKHYNVSNPGDPKPKLIEPKAGANPFGSEKACMDFGGGGLIEKLTRFRMLRKTALELQKEVGKLEEEDAFNDLVESCWSGMGDIQRRRAANLAAKNFIETPTSAFPANTVPSVTNNTPAPNVIKKADLPATRIVQARQDEMNFMGDVGAEGNPMLEITYEGGYTERMTQDTLKAAIQSRITSRADAAFGYCLMYPECQARLYPSDVKEFVDAEIYDKYRRFFNEKFRVSAGIGGAKRSYRSRRMTRKSINRMHK
jgi:uncharacterized protein